MISPASRSGWQNVDEVLGMFAEDATGGRARDPDGPAGQPGAAGVHHGLPPHARLPRQLKSRLAGVVSAGVAR